MSTVSDYFGSLVFDDRVMKAMLSPMFTSLSRRLLTKEQVSIMTSPTQLPPL